MDLNGYGSGRDDGHRRNEAHTNRCKNKMPEEPVPCRQPTGQLSCLTDQTVKDAPLGKCKIFSVQTGSDDADEIVYKVKRRRKTRVSNYSC